MVLTTLFLDCGGHELERRFNETRRRHFLAQDLPVADGIAAERELLGPLRRWADVLIDTTHFSTNDLQQRIRELFAATAPQDMTVTVTSFGFARGMPPVADLVFDMRFLDNPHWDPALRDLTGTDQAVGAHIERDPAFASVFAESARPAARAAAALRGAGQKLRQHRLRLYRRKTPLGVHGREDRRGLARRRVFAHCAAPQPGVASCRND